jgi:hypothetical protein
MSKNDFIKLLKSRGATCEEFNSNNAWGFGGAYGDRLTLGSHVIKVATACYRHLDPVKFITVTLGGDRILDAGQGSKAFDRAALILGIQ